MTSPLETGSSGSHPVATGLRDGIALGVSKLLAAGLAVLALKALLRTTEEIDYGRYGAFLLASNLAIAFTAWPVASTLRLGAEEWKEKRRLARTFLLHIILVLASAALLAAPLYAAREEVDRYITVPGATLIVLGYALVTSLANVAGALLKPAGRVARFALLPLVTRVFYLGALATCVFRGRTLDAHEVMLVCLATAVPQLLVALAFVAPWVVPPAVRVPIADQERAIGFGLPVLFRQLGLQAFAYVNYATIKHWKGLIEAGRFNVSGTLAEQTALFAVAVEDLMGPILARAAARAEGKTLDTYYRTIAPQVVFLWATGCGVLLIVAQPLLAALSAKAVLASAGALQVLFLATTLRMVVSVEQPVFDAHLIATPPLIFFALGFATNLVLDVVLVPTYGIEGAAWATVAGWLVNASLRSVYLRARFAVRSLGLYLGVLPAAIATGYARFYGGASPLQDAEVALGFALGTIVIARAVGVFRPETLAALEGVRMPWALRRALVRFYGAPS